ncbi:BirA family biotin operon repressor/biotin-[acetyl-CoA-carboxylase] ligase [Hasllibacter halocynthiae]|uniref:biotin--[biotin carboxyl-carrier protein] ligase n=1 Tax=Hasllibacter halocynthiae TaxID=595589 RepID=A0A2T0X7W2_9RHOB|nr:biotin--[acetyl-CoA-carboxylase] ligase [Hasllibacter halocynthiae]PRY95040.1 BirA family biotin operon repressor/biotin-[acetyl-CoA-carboxylase] ligase [Hasllibacter halocynthiae]
MARPEGEGAGWPAGVERIVLPECASTMAEARRIADGREGPFWVLAHRQTSGRGRRGRSWLMPEGNFAATGVFEAPPAEAPLRSFVAAVALRDALEGVRGQAGLSLKWPNDVLLGGRKLAGILLEGLPGGRVAVGVGVNLAAAPPSDALPEGALPAVALDRPCTPEGFLDRLAPAFARWEGALRAGGFAEVRAEWMRHAARLGERVAVRLPRGVVEGRMEGIAPDGALVLATVTGERRVSAGDVLP